MKKLILFTVLSILSLQSQAITDNNTNTGVGTVCPDDSADKERFLTELMYGSWSGQQENLHKLFNFNSNGK